MHDDALFDKIFALQPRCQTPAAARALAIARTQIETYNLLSLASVAAPSDPVHSADARRCAEVWADEAERLAKHGA